MKLEINSIEWLSLIGDYIFICVCVCVCGGDFLSHESDIVAFIAPSI